MPFTIPNTAPFTGAQKSWLQGYLDGLNTALESAGSQPSSAAAKPPGKPVTIIWGSQTGTSESLGKKLAKSLTAEGHLPTVRDMAEVSPADLVGVENLCVITSTYGDGEPPDNAGALHAALHATDTPSLASLNYTVLALGDSSYPDFCKCGHDFDKRLEALGATRISPLVECDVDYDEPFAVWLSQLSGGLKTNAA